MTRWESNSKSHTGQVSILPTGLHHQSLHSMQTSITCFEFGTSKLPEGHWQVRPWPDCVPLTSLIHYRVDQTSLVTQSPREHIPQGREATAAASFLPP